MARAVLIYDLAKRHLVEELKYPPGLIDMQYDKEFAIMVSSFFYVTTANSSINSVLIYVSHEQYWCIYMYMSHNAMCAFFCCRLLACADAQSQFCGTPLTSFCLRTVPVLFVSLPSKRCSVRRFL